LPLKLFLWLAAVLCSAPPGLAATLSVTTTNDSGAGSLRQSIQNAASGDSINFAVAGTITLINGELLITNNLNIVGPGQTNLLLDGNHASRVFEISSNVMVSISDLAMTNGFIFASSGHNEARGGDVYNSGNLTLRRCTVCRGSLAN